MDPMGWTQPLLITGYEDMDEAEVQALVEAWKPGVILTSSVEVHHIEPDVYAMLTGWEVPIAYRPIDSKGTE